MARKRCGRQAPFLIAAVLFSLVIIVLFTAHVFFDVPLLCHRPTVPTLIAVHAPDDACEITIVTSYFEIPSKHSALEYRRWMRDGVLSLDACMVIFTSQRDLPRRTGPGLTRWHYYDDVSLDALSVARLNRTATFWEGQHALDPERAVHRSHALYIVWALKPVFMHDVVRENPFRSRYFLWLDIGCLRDATYRGRSMRRMIAPLPPAGTVVFGIVAPFSRAEVRAVRDGPFAFSGLPFERDHLTGGLWYGDGPAITRFHDAYLTLFDALDRAGRFVGKDQNLMNLLCLRVTNLCAVAPPDPCLRYDVWMHLVPFMLGDSVPTVSYLNAPLSTITSLSWTAGSGA